MQPEFSIEFRNSPEGERATSVLQKCVHCGFCNATCPTYGVLGDELDGPRGRLYLMKQYLEGSTPADAIEPHLDRCLTCKACETTCPSGVKYSSLLDLTRRRLEVENTSPGRRRFRKWLVAFFLSRRLFGWSLALGRLFRPLLPGRFKRQIPVRRLAGKLPERQHARQVILHEGCVQNALNANLNAATIRVLDRLGIQTLTAAGAGCCGALESHYGSHARGDEMARRNVEAWLPLLEADAECVVSNASGCGVTLKDYGEIFAQDKTRAESALRVADAVRDIGEVVAERLSAEPDLCPKVDRPMAVAFHAPCSLQHGLRKQQAVLDILKLTGAEVHTPADAHLCCGSAGMYAQLHPEIGGQLRDNKLRTLEQTGGSVILTANIGCQTHLQAATGAPVMHWIEWLDQQFSGGS